MIRESGSEERGARRRELPADALERWAGRPDESVRLETYVDTLPDGMAAFMMPMIVDWSRSQPDDEDAFFVVRNVNHGGNILAGTTELVTARIPVNGVREVQFVLVPLDGLGTRGFVDHTQLRFVFESGSGAELISESPRSVGSNVWSDLVLSWEAWRPPGYRFNLVEGMDPDSFRLTPRLFTGAQRFLEECSKGREWYAYPLELPGGGRGRAELIRVAFSLAHAIARSSMLDVLRHAKARFRIDATPEFPPERADDERSIWAMIEDRLQRNHVTDDPFRNIPDDMSRYQLLQRSCATMALHTIDLAVNRTGYEVSPEGTLSPPISEEDLAQPIPWMEQIRRSHWSSVLRHAAYALWWISRHQTVVPTRIPGFLDRAGLLRRENGQPVVHHYRSGTSSPYIRPEDFRSD